MNSWSLIDETTGRVVMTGEGGEAPLHDGTFAIDEAANFDSDYYDLDAKELRKFPDKPSASHEWDYSAKAWVQNSGKAIAAVRATRDSMLAACDWTQLPDVPAETKAAWAAYRQALRDVTDQPGFPDDVVWPEPPK